MAAVAGRPTPKSQVSAYWRGAQFPDGQLPVGLYVSCLRQLNPISTRRDNHGAAIDLDAGTHQHIDPALAQAAVELRRERAAQADYFIRRFVGHRLPPQRSTPPPLRELSTREPNNNTRLPGGSSGLAAAAMPSCSSTVNRIHPVYSARRLRCRLHCRCWAGTPARRAAGHIEMMGRFLLVFLMPIGLGGGPRQPGPVMYDAALTQDIAEVARDLQKVSVSLCVCGSGVRSRSATSLIELAALTIAMGRMCSRPCR